MSDRFLGLSPLQDVSILRKFTVLFLVMSILPLLVLFYLYHQVKASGRIDITEDTFNTTLLLVGTGIAVGYFSMRMLLKKIITLTITHHTNLMQVLGKEKVEKISTKGGDEIAVMDQTFREMINSLEQNIRYLQNAKQTLHSVLAKVGEGISSLQNIDSFLNLILETVVDALDAKVGVLLFHDDSRGELWIKTVYGEKKSDSEVRIPLAKSMFRQLIKEKRPIVIEQMMEDSLEYREYSNLFVAPFLCTPLMINERVLGFMVVGGKKNPRQFFGEDEKNIMFNLGMQTAVAIENARLSEDAEKTYFETISALALAVDARDRYSRGHLDRVAAYVVRLGNKLKVSPADLKILHDAAKLHDVGKIGVPDEVLMKADSLSDQEWAVMKKHPEIGEGIIKPIRSLRNLCDIIRHHHEKLDGSGYPDGLKGEDISLLVRITTVADIYDALTTDRPYRKRFTFAEAAEELRGMKGKLDQRIVEAFLSTFDEEPKSNESIGRNF